jgi:S-adenosylmethionine-diacylglycerol 3-amino-3-carboxypropyl transferase
MTSPGQVALSDLLFGMSWEDPASDRAALRLVPGQSLLTISSGGCNTLSFLLDDPARIHAVDINASQSHLLALKCAAIKRLDRDGLLAFLGITPSARRLELFESVAAELNEDATSYWRARSDAIEAGVVLQGRFEKFLARFRSFLRLLQGRRRIDGLFAAESLEAQQRYFDETWNTRRWRMLFRLAFNKRTLAKRGLSADYFRFDDGSTSFADSFLNRARGAFRDLPIRSNYFLAQYLLGRYLSPDAVPDYLRAENLPIVRERLDRIEIITADAKEWLAARPPRSIDAFSLSNISELMNAADTAVTFREVARTATPGARICFRNLMVPRDVPPDLQQTIRLDEETSRRMLRNDRSFVYSRVNAYVVEG